MCVCGVSVCVCGECGVSVWVSVGVSVGLSWGECGDECGVSVV